MEKTLNETVHLSLSMDSPLIFLGLRVDDGSPNIPLEVITDSSGISYAKCVVAILICAVNIILHSAVIYFLHMLTILQ